MNLYTEVETTIFFDARLHHANWESLFRIMQDYKFNSHTLHVFVEAEDDEEFYKKTIEHVYREYDIMFYPKHGKKYVIGAYESIDWRKYKKGRILFFADKDYEDLLGLNSKKDLNFFVTKFYSIENYIASPEVFTYCLKKIFKIQDDMVIELLLLYYLDAFNVFQNKLVLITSLVLIYRKSSNDIELDKIKMDDFFKFKDFNVAPTVYRRPHLCQAIKRSDCKGFEKSLVRNVKNIDILGECVTDKSLIKTQNLLQNLRQLQQISDGRIFIRGKYHLWFFCKFFKEIKHHDKMINGVITQGNNINVTIDINESNIFDILPMKLGLQEDVLDFLTLTYNHV